MRNHFTQISLCAFRLRLPCKMLWLHCASILYSICTDKYVISCTQVCTVNNDSISFAILMPREISIRLCHASLVVNFAYYFFTEEHLVQHLCLPHPSYFVPCVPRLAYPFIPCSMLVTKRLEKLTSPRY